MFLNPEKPAVILAPMEGITDAPFREFITRTGYYDYCVSEFIRVSANVLNAKTFKKHIPELNHESRTRAGTAVQIQLLGGDPDRLAESALNAIEAGATGIDLNFGCPAPTVNRHDGGATLLQYPDRIEKIIRTVRDRVPSHFPVSAKMRLGFADPEAIHENARRAEQAGASWITIHGRTKTQGYIPPAYWKPIGQVRAALSIPVVANGEIWTIEDFRKCREETGSIHFMIGRAALARPTLAREMRKELGLPLNLASDREPMIITDGLNAVNWAGIFEEYANVQPSEKRIKQWIRYLAHQRQVAWWEPIKGLGSTPEILNCLREFQESP
jgi:tRNA-dihydrouridine synthase C